MIKEAETEETIVFFVTFLSLVAFQLGGGGLGPMGPPSGYAYGTDGTFSNCIRYLKKKYSGFSVFCHHLSIEN